MIGKRAARPVLALGLLVLTATGLLGPGATTARAQQAPPAGRAGQAGLWTKATTVATFRGRWMEAQRYRRFQDTQSPDEVLRHFAHPTAVRLTAVALETGFDVFLRARANPGEGVPVPGKDLEVVFHARQDRTSAGRPAFQPTFTLRLTRRAGPPPLPPLPPPPLPGLPRP